MKVTVFGIGYVGLVQAAVLAEVGHDVLCIDVDEKKVENLKKGNIPIFEPGLTPLVMSNYESGRLKFSTNAEEGVARTSPRVVARTGPPLLPLWPRSSNGSAPACDVNPCRPPPCRSGTADGTIANLFPLSWARFLTERQAGGGYPSTRFHGDLQNVDLDSPRRRNPDDRRLGERHRARRQGQPGAYRYYRAEGRCCASRRDLPAHPAW